MFCLKKFYKLRASLENINTIKDSKCFQNQHPIYGGKGIIYTSPQSNGNYNLRVWIKEESHYFRKSLRTRIFGDAVILAEQEVLSILTKINNGHKIAGSSWGELCELFLKHQEERVKTERITKGRLVTIRSQITKHIIPFIGSKLRLSEISKHSFIDYAMFRRQTFPEVQDVTIINEHTTINSIIKYGFRKGYLPFERGETEDIKIKGEVSRRDCFTSEEYNTLIYAMRKWVKDTILEKDKYNRQLLRDFILINANTFMRFGEMMQLKWKMLGYLKKEWSEKKTETFLNFSLPAEICKNRKSRTVVSRGNEYIERIKKYSSKTGNDDYIFTTKGGDLVGKKLMYSLWNELIPYAKLDEANTGKKLTFYSLRHFGITCRLYAQVPIYEVSKLAGTSVVFIENHYSHIDMAHLLNSASKSFHIDKNGIHIATGGY